MTSIATEGAHIVTLDAPGAARPRERATSGTAGLASAHVDRSEQFAQMRAGELGSVHSWELVTAVDGPGTRMTTFLSGCPLSCLYCHNPDTMAMRRGTPITADEVLGRLRRYAPVLKATGGGLTISGGEPLMQPSFTARLLRGAKELGLHTALDTSGFLGKHCNDTMLDDIDLVLLDVKSGIAETYTKVTGRELAPTLEFGRTMADSGTEIWIRFVLVPGLTDAEANVAAVADYAATLPTATRVEVLPFHQMGADKWRALGLDYQLDGVEPPSYELLARVRGQFRDRGLTVY